MNWEATSIRQKVLVLTKGYSNPMWVVGCVYFVVVAVAGLQAKESEYFSLPPNKKTIKIPYTQLSFEGRGVGLKSSRTRQQSIKIDAQTYFFEKQTFLTKKRDQAIKLLRQELNSGYRKNRDNVLMRLGQLYTEKYMELNYYEVQLYNDRIEEYKKLQKEGKAKKRKRPKLKNGRSRRYLTRALKVLTRLEREYPRHPRMDEVMFFIGFVNMEFGKLKKGSRYLERLVARYPQSSKYEEATLYLADYYFDAQRFSKALGKYQILLRKKNTELYDYARYKIAWCHLNLNREEIALKEMKEVIANLKGADEKSKFNLREQALNDIATFFADTGKVDEAFSYYSETLGEEKAYEKMKLIAGSLHGKAKDRPAIQAYKILLDKDKEALQGPEYAVATYESQVRLRQTASAVETLEAALLYYGETSEWAARYREKDPKGLAEKLKALQKDGTNAAFFYHRTAQKTKRKNYYEYGRRLYAALEKAFPNHPEKRKLVFYQGEILYAQKKWLPAADMYMKIAQSPPKDKLAEEAAYNALLSVDQLTARSQKIKRFSKKEIREKKFEPQPIPESEKRFIEVAQFYLQRYSKFKRATDVRFRIAGIYYRYYHFDKAAPIFKDIAENQPRHKHATASAHLLLDIYNINSDYKNLSDASTVFASKKGLGNKAFKAEMRSFREQLGFKSIEKLEKEEKWGEAGDAYLKYYKANSRGKLARGALYNAVVTYEKSKNLAKQQEVNRLFMAKYPRDPYTKRLTLLEAKRAETGFDYQSAQRFYENYAQKYPKAEEARKALYNAAVFAELMNQNRKALKLYERYTSRGRVGGQERKAIDLSRAKLYRRVGNWRKTAEIYNALSRRAPTLQERIEILGELSDLYKRNGRTRDRKKTLEKIGRLTRNESQAKGFGAGVPYIAEARLMALQPQRTRYRRKKLRLPPKRLVRDIKQKQTALTKLDESYEKVIQLGDPEWGVAALAERAEAYDQFVSSYRNVKVPSSYKGAQRKELMKQLKQLEGDLISPFEKRAIEFRELCLSKAVQFHVATDSVKRCRSGIGNKNKNLSQSPSGILPRPAYWTTRWGNREVPR